MLRSQKFIQYSNELYLNFTLALLCASLAWQKYEFHRVMDYNEGVRNGSIEPDEVDFDAEEIEQMQLQMELDPGLDSGAGFYVQGDDDADDFQDSNSKR